MYGTTIQYDIHSVSWTGKVSYEDDYSIHLTGRLSPDEFRESMEEFSSVATRFKPSTLMLIVHILLGQILGCVYIPILLLEKPWSIYAFPALYIATGLGFFILGMWKYNQQAKERTHELHQQVEKLNGKYNVRGINFRVRQGTRSYDRDSVCTYGTRVEIEVAALFPHHYTTPTSPQEPLMYGAIAPPFFQTIFPGAPAASSSINVETNEKQPLLPKV